MINRLRFYSILGFFLAVMSLSAQTHATDRQSSSRNQNDNRVPGLGRNSLLVNINARILESDGTIIWNQTESRNTIPGRPVGINLVGSNVAVVMQFTPFIRREASVLVVQSQIWVEDPEKGVSSFASIQTIPVRYGEPLHIFPLGSSPEPSPSIEIIITVNPYNPASN